MTRILVADALTIFRSGVRNLLVRESDFDVAEADDLHDVEAEIELGCPDIALIDLELPPLGGVAAVRALSKACSTHMIVWSFEPTRDTVLAAIRAGASGYLHKQVSPQGLLRALRGVLQGEAPISRHLTSLMIEALHELEERERLARRADVLSDREREVLDLVARGARNKQIAQALTISEFTVKRHVQNILQKLDLPTRRAAAAFYRSAYGPDEALVAAAGVT